MMNNRRLSLPASFVSKEGDPSKTDDKSLPRYLQSSAGSCHDLCKFGKHHHKLEKNHKNPFPKKTTNSEQIPSSKKPTIPHIHKTKPMNPTKLPPSTHFQSKPNLTQIKPIPTKKPPPLYPKKQNSFSKVTTPLTHSSRRSNKRSSSISSRPSLPSKLPEEKTLYVVTDDKLEKISSKFCDSLDEKKAGKLELKRGKVVETSADREGPRRLMFRPGKVLEDEELAKELKMKFKGGPPGKGCEEQKEPEKVVLRHQDVQGKKDEQGLLNNVIEETANKLVETRKSKVKALVGAFETVISLQDGSNIVH